MSIPSNCPSKIDKNIPIDQKSAYFIKNTNLITDKLPFYKKTNAISETNIGYSLKPRQEFCVLRFTEFCKRNGMLLMHNVGSGKTVTSVEMAVNLFSWLTNEDAKKYVENAIANKVTLNNDMTLLMNEITTLSGKVNELVHKKNNSNNASEKQELNIKILNTCDDITILLEKYSSISGSFIVPSRKVLVVTPTGLFSQLNDEIEENIPGIHRDSESGCEGSIYHYRREYFNKNGQINFKSSPSFTIEAKEYKNFSSLFVSYDENVAKIKNMFKDKIVIFDEAHRLFRPFNPCDPNSMIIDKYITDNLLSEAKNVIFMTGTPLKTSVLDMFSLLRLITTPKKEMEPLYVSESFNLNNINTYKEYTRPLIISYEESKFSAVVLSIRRTLYFLKNQFYYNNYSKSYSREISASTEYIKKKKGLNFAQQLTKSGNFFSYFSFSRFINRKHFKTPIKTIGISIGQQPTIGGNKKLKKNKTYKKIVNKKNKTLKLIGGMKLNEAYQVLPVNIPEANTNSIVNEGTDSYDIVKQKYRQLALATHPDKPGGDVATFQKLNEAYKTITGEIPEDIIEELPIPVDQNYVEDILYDFNTFFQNNLGYIYNKTTLEKILKKLDLFEDESILNFENLIENGDLIIEMFTTPPEIYSTYLSEGLDYILEVDNDELVKNIEIVLKKGEYYQQIWMNSIEPNMKIVECFAPDADVKTILFGNTNNGNDMNNTNNINEEEEIDDLETENNEKTKISNTYTIDGVQYLTDEEVKKIEVIQELLEKNPDSEEVKKFFELSGDLTPELQDISEKIEEYFSNFGNEMDEIRLQVEKEGFTDSINQNETNGEETNSDMEKELGSENSNDLKQSGGGFGNIVFTYALLPLALYTITASGQSFGLKTSGFFSRLKSNIPQNPEIVDYAKGIVGDSANLANFVAGSVADSHIFDAINGIQNSDNAGAVADVAKDSGSTTVTSAALNVFANNIGTLLGGVAEILANPLNKDELSDIAKQNLFEIVDNIENAGELLKSSNGAIELQKGLDSAAKQASNIASDITKKSVESVKQRFDTATGALQEGFNTTTGALQEGFKSAAEQAYNIKEKGEEAFKQGLDSAAQYAAQYAAKKAFDLVPKLDLPVVVDKLGITEGSKEIINSVLKKINESPTKEENNFFEEVKNIFKNFKENFSGIKSIKKLIIQLLSASKGIRIYLIKNALNIIMTSIYNYSGTVLKYSTKLLINLGSILSSLLLSPNTSTAGSSFGYLNMLKFLIKSIFEIIFDVQFLMSAATAYLTTVALSNMLGSSSLLTNTYWFLTKGYEMGYKKLLIQQYIVSCRKIRYFLESNFKTKLDPFKKANEGLIFTWAKKNGYEKLRGVYAKKLIKKNAYGSLDLDKFVMNSQRVISTIITPMPQINEFVFNCISETNINVLESVYTQGLLTDNTITTKYPERVLQMRYIFYSGYQFLLYQQFKSLKSIAKNRKNIQIINEYLPWFFNRDELLQYRFLGNTSYDISYPLSVLKDRTKSIVYFDPITALYKLNIDADKVRPTAIIQTTATNYLAFESNIRKSDVTSINFSCPKFDKILANLLFMKTGKLVIDKTIRNKSSEKKYDADKLTFDNYFDIIDQAHFTLGKLNSADKDDPNTNYKEIKSQMEKDQTNVQTLPSDNAYSYLPFVYSTSDELGLNLFAYYLSSKGLKYVVLHETTVGDKSKEMNNKALHETYKVVKPSDPKKADEFYRNYVIDYKIYEEKIPNVQIDFVSLFLSSLSDEDKNKIKGDDADPICVLLHPFRTEGIDAKFNPAIFLMEPALNFGDYEQLCGRVLRSYTYEFNKKPKKFVYQFLTSSPHVFETFISDYLGKENSDRALLPSERHALKDFFVEDNSPIETTGVFWSNYIGIKPFKVPLLSRTFEDMTFPARATLDLLVPDYSLTVGYYSQLEDIFLYKINKDLADIDKKTKELLKMFTSILNLKDTSRFTNLTKNLLQSFIDKIDEIQDLYFEKKSILEKLKKNNIYNQEIYTKLTERHEGMATVKPMVLKKACSLYYNIQYILYSLEFCTNFIMGAYIPSATYTNPNVTVIIENLNISFLEKLLEYIVCIPNVNDFDEIYINSNIELNEIMNIKITEFEFNQITEKLAGLIPTVGYEPKKICEVEGEKRIPDVDFILKCSKNNKEKLLCNPSTRNRFDTCYKLSLNDDKILDGKQQQIQAKSNELVEFIKTKNTDLLELKEKGNDTKTKDEIKIFLKSAYIEINQKKMELKNIYDTDKEETIKVIAEEEKEKEEKEKEEKEKEAKEKEKIASEEKEAKEGIASEGIASEEKSNILNETEIKKKFDNLNGIKPEVVVQAKKIDGFSTNREEIIQYLGQMFGRGNSIQNLPDSYTIQNGETVENRLFQELLQYLGLDLDFSDSANRIAYIKTSDNKNVLKYDGKMQIGVSRWSKVENGGAISHVNYFKNTRKNKKLSRTRTQRLI